VHRKAFGKPLSGKPLNSVELLATCTAKRMAVVEKKEEESKSDQDEMGFGLFSGKLLLFNFARVGLILPTH
jgi:hypothetical protein